MRCLGRTKTLRRCKNQARRVFCQHHRFQPLAVCIFLLGLLAALAGLYQDLWNPLRASLERELPFQKVEREDIEYFDFDETPAHDYPLTFPDLPRAPELGEDCKRVVQAGVRRGIDRFVVCEGEHFTETWLEVYRPQASSPFQKRYPRVGNARYEKLFDEYESTVVASYQVGSAGFLTITILMWVSDTYRELTNWVQTENYSGTFDFVDVNRDGWKELIVREGRWVHQEKFRIFEFNPERLEYMEWPDNDKRMEDALEEVRKACEIDEELFEALCSELQPSP